MESTQMPIDRLDKGNVIHIHHEHCKHKKKMRSCPLQDMDGAGSHYPQQTTNTGTENQTLHVPNYKWELNDENIWIHGGKQYTLGPVGGVEEGRASGRRANGYWA